MRILQLHTRYREAGGEDAVVRDETRLLPRRRSRGHRAPRVQPERHATRLRCAGPVAVEPCQPPRAVKRAVASAPSRRGAYPQHLVLAVAVGGAGPEAMRRAGRDDAAQLPALLRQRAAVPRRTPVRGLRRHPPLARRAAPLLPRLVRGLRVRRLDHRRRPRPRHVVDGRRPFRRAVVVPAGQARGRGHPGRDDLGQAPRRGRPRSAHDAAVELAIGALPRTPLAREGRRHPARRVGGTRCVEPGAGAGRRRPAA